MDLCVNCCQSLPPRPKPLYSGEDDDNIIDNDKISAADENPQQFVVLPSSNPIEISKALSSIYKLNYLNAFLDPSDPDPLMAEEPSSSSSALSPESEGRIVNWNSNLTVKLCDICLEALTTLYKFYDGFNQLRTLESCLAKDIQKLDHCIQAHEIIRKIKKEKDDEVEMDPDLDPRFNSNSNQRYRDRDALGFCTSEYGFDDSSCAPEELDDENSNSNSNSRSFSRKRASNISPFGPWVVVKKLENDPLAQSALTANGRAKRAIKRPRKMKQTPKKEYSEPDGEDSKRKVETEGEGEEKEGEEVETIDGPKVEEEGDITYLDSNDEDYDDSPAGPPDDPEADSDFYIEDDGEESIEENATDSEGEWKAEREIKPRKTRARKPARRRGRKAENLVSENDADDNDNDDDEAEPVRKKKSTRKSKSSDGVKRKRNRRSKYSESEKRIRIRETEKEKRERKKIDKAYKRRKVKVPNPCWYCPLDFPTPADCLTHTMEAHFQEQPGFSICQKCSKISNSKMSQAFHDEKQCESLKPGEILPMLQCPQCPKTFPLQYYLTAHMVIHRDGFLECKYEGCTFQTKNKYSLQQHVRGQHKPLDQPVEERTCKECGRVFKTKVSLHSHFVKYHTEEGSKKYQIKQRALLDRQKEERKVRLASRKSICQDCGVDFITNLALVYHRKEFHKSNFTLVCEICGKGFARQATLRYHMEYVHTTERNFFCDACGKSFKTATNLKDHYKRTHDEQGRLQYNLSMKLHNQRRKARGQALAISLNSGKIVPGQHSLAGTQPTPEQLLGYNLGEPSTSHNNNNSSNSNSQTSDHQNNMLSAASAPNNNPPPPFNFGFNSNFHLGLPFPLTNQFKPDNNMS